MKKSKNVELVIERTPWTPLPEKFSHDSVVALQIAAASLPMRTKANSADTKLNPDIQLGLLISGSFVGTEPKQQVVVHSDQGRQFTSEDWRAILKTHNLEQSMSRRGNCYDNAVAESYFSY